MSKNSPIAQKLHFLKAQEMMKSYFSLIIDYYTILRATEKYAESSLTSSLLNSLFTATALD